MSKKALIFVFLFSPVFLFSIELDDTLLFNKNSWNIAIERLSGDLSTNNDYLRSSISDLIKKELQSSNMHLLSGGEIINFQKRLIEEKRISIIDELSLNYLNRDKLLFNENSENTSLKDLNEKISQLKDSLLELAFFDSTTIKTAEMLQVKWIGSDENSDLLKSNEFMPSVVSKKYDLDFLIKGSIKEIDEYFFLEVQGFNYSTAEEIQFYSNAGSSEDIELMAKTAAKDIRSIILGRAWSELIVETDNPDALIYSDGVLIGVGKAEINTIEPGTVFLEAIGYDNSYWSTEAELDALETILITAELSKSETEFITLSSNPAEADVYIGARWAGKTPLKLPRYEDRNIWVSIKSEGYYDKSFEVSNKSPMELYFELEEEELTRLELFDMRKKDFYKSLGWFSLSVAGPVVAGGVYSNFADRHNGYASAYQATSDPAYYDLAKEMERNYYISYGVFWGTIGVSGGLLVDLFVKLSRYIKAAEALAE